MSSYRILFLAGIFLSFSFCMGGGYDYDYSLERSFENFFNDSAIQDIRLRGNLYGDHAGRVEVMYNDTWGTICDLFWSFSDAKVACGMLGYSGAVCSVSDGEFGSATLEVPIWMDRLQCRGFEEALDYCAFSGWEENSCDHSNDAGVICMDDTLIPQPKNVSLISSRRTSLVIGWDAVTSLPTGIVGVQYIIRYQAENSKRSTLRFVYSSPYRHTRQYTISSLSLNTTYKVEVRSEVRYRECFNYMSGNYSDPILVSTNATARISNIPVRLVHPEAGLDFIGRVEVFHGNKWGTVCDDNFGLNEAHIFCRMANFTRAICSIPQARLGAGSGQIWLDNIRCRNAEILEDCSFNSWGSHNCDHRDDVGIVCFPNDFPPKIQNVTITNSSAVSVTLSWQPFDFPTTASTRRYIISYKQEGSFYRRRRFISSRVSSYTINSLQFAATYNFTIIAEIRFSFCAYLLRGVESDLVTITTVETSPSGPPISFHVTVLSCSSIRAEWQLPKFNNRNGFIRGFKLYLQPSAGGNEMLFNITSNETTEFIMMNLSPDTRYVASILAYTVGDGPRSIHLTARTNPQNICHRDIINFFGINGDGLDRARISTRQTDIHIFCGSSLEGVKLDWFFSNGTKVGITNRNIREGHFPNGTASLQIASDRRVSPCDSGIYSCRATQVLNETERAEEKDFKLTIGTGPPQPSRPEVTSVTSTSVTISWNENECDGGHSVQSFNIRYGLSFQFFFRPSSSFITGIEQRKYTINNLNPSTTYRTSVQAVGVDFTFSAYSIDAIFTTLEPAPSPPRVVSVVLVTPVILQVTWEKPRYSIGTVVFFTVYAFPLVTKTSSSARTRRQTSDVLGGLSKNFTATELVGNLTLPQQSVSYHVQVSATIRTSAGAIRETELSPIDTRTTIFVPLPGLPVPVNVKVSVSNSSVSMTWDYPPPPTDLITEFKVLYSGRVDGVSPEGTLVKFDHEGIVTTPTNEIVVEPLTPGTAYLFKVSAITLRGEGKEVTAEAQTDGAKSDFEKFVYFHIRFGPVLSCVDFRTQDIEKKRNVLKEQLVTVLTDLCNCDISSLNIQNDAFGCGQLNHLITYRGRILGTKNYNAIGLVQLMQFWVDTSLATVTIDSFRLQVDPTCTTRLDTINAPDCPLTDILPPTIQIPTTDKSDATIQRPTTDKSDATKPGASPSSGSNSGIRSGEVGGIAIGVIIILLLAILVMTLLGFMLYKCRGYLPLKYMRHTNGQEEDKNAFAAMEPRTSESSLFEEKMKD